MSADRSPSHYTVIKASAGSGKTYRLTQELTERLSRRRADGTPEFRPSEIIATTFTRKAAAELSGRIREHLVDSGELAQAAAMPTSLIGTVNSITGNILQEFAVDAGRSPELAVLSETAQARAFSLAVDEIIAGAEEDHRALLVRMGYNLGPDDQEMYNHGKVNWAKTVRKVIDLARSNDIDPDEFPALAEKSETGLFAALNDVAGEAGSGGRGVGDARRAITDTITRVISDVRADLSEGSVRKTSIGPLEELIGPAERFVLDVTTDPDTAATITWSEWFAAAEGKVPGATRKPTKPWETAFADQVPAEVFAADPGLRGDLKTLIRLVFDTARDCLTAYSDYKQALGQIDFTDQEQLTLHLLREDSPRGQVVRDTLAERFRILVVDEFQDTSPLQLALFTELGALVDEVIWVGDPKQSIYGFRGADPSLMSDALEVITAGGGSTDILHHSWRTHEVPLNLSNRLFSRVFDGEPGTDNPNGEVWLDVPDPLAEKHADGDVQVWVPAKGTHKTQLDLWFTRVARGLLDLQHAEGVPEKGRAVLARTNSHADKLRDALRSWGVPVEGGGTPLLSTREGATVRAACAWLIDPSDTQALVELISILGDHPAHTSWFDQLTSPDTAPDKAARKKLLDEWAKDDSLAALVAVRPLLAQHTVTDTLIAVVDALDLRARVASWADPGERTGAVNGLLQAAADYTDDAVNAGDPVTLSGFLTYLDPDSHDDDSTVPTTRPARTADAVVVSTIHQAKGLEWDTVVVMPPRPSDRFRAAGVWVDAPDTVSLDAPLAGRSLRFWPETLLGSPVLTEVLSGTEVQETRRETEREEEQRLLYVAMTRSRRRTVLAPHNTLEDLAAFADTDLGLTEVVGVEDPDTGATDRCGLQISWEESADFFGCPVHEVSSDLEALTTLLNDGTERPVHPAALLDADRHSTVNPVDTPVSASVSASVSPPENTGGSGSFLPATFTASSVKATDEVRGSATVAEIADLGEPLINGGGKEWNKVGDCIHSYLAAPLGSLDREQKRTTAERLVTSWRVGDRVTAEQVVECGERWTAWVTATYPGAQINSEVPFTWTNPQSQRAKGWLDELLTLPDGTRVVVDHKTYPGKDPVQKVETDYLGQMDTYRQALTDIDGTPPTGILIHLPLRGEVLEVRFG